MPKNIGSTTDTLSICATIDAGLSELVAELRLIREALEKQAEDIAEISATIEEVVEHGS